MSPFQPNTIATPPGDERLLTLTRLVAASPAVLYSCKVTEDYGTIAVTENVRKVLGYAPEDFVGDPGFWAVRIHPDDSARVFGEMPRLFRQGEQTIDYRFRHASCGYIWLRDHMKIEFDAEGCPWRLLGCWLDVTGQKQGAVLDIHFPSVFSKTTKTLTTGGNYATQT